ncbi:aldehyde dehydrogenase family protein [Nocardioides dubius]|uniref:Aldehyde dehydrogenase family protein n=1 Tax=Nocardioides dubius TaxID=317019 RepID=A0ABP4EHV7_9ACTN
MRYETVLIGGRWLPTTETIEVENPATMQVVGTSGRASVAQVDLAVAAARDALPAWGSLPPEQRATALDRLVDALRGRRRELIDVTVAEVGTPVADATAWHVDLGIELVVSAIRNLRAHRFESEVGNSLLFQRPVGVAACITPWNYPFYQLTAKVAPALAAGCTVVLKPAELTPLSAYLFAEAVEEAGLPAGVFNLLPGIGAEIGAALADHDGVDLVSFTGSTKVGRAVGAAAAGRLAKVCLELGGKSASLVCADADLDTAVRATVESAMLNAGQTCSAWTRLLVPAERYDEAVEIAGKHAADLVVGDPTDERTQVGPLVSRGQWEQVSAMVAAAVARGARLVTGGGAPDGLRTGHYLAPTVLADLAPQDPASQEEIFGPVLVVHPYADEDEAIRIANGTRYGLAGAVWSGAEERALSIARRLETGQVDLNGAAFNPEAPFGGWKDSGLGRELGRVGLEEYLEWTAVQR